MSQQMYAFEPQTFADSGFYLRALCGKYPRFYNFPFSIFNFQLSTPILDNLDTLVQNRKTTENSHFSPQSSQRTRRTAISHHEVHEEHEGNT